MFEFGFIAKGKYSAFDILTNNVSSFDGSILICLGSHCTIQHFSFHFAKILREKVHFASFPFFSDKKLRYTFHEKLLSNK